MHVAKGRRIHRGARRGYLEWKRLEAMTFEERLARIAKIRGNIPMKPVRLLPGTP